MDLEPNINLDALARRVVAHLRPAPDIRDDLIQQANVFGLDLLQRFQPRNDADSPEPTVQAERYLFVSLQWHLREYARQLRSPLPMPERDRRVARDYQALVSQGHPLTLEEAARRLGIRPIRLARVLSSSETVVSLDDVGVSANDEAQSALSERVRSNDPGPEQTVVTALDDERQVTRDEILARAIRNDDRESTTDRRRKTRRVLYLFLDELPDTDAEVIRLSYSLPRKERGGLRSCRTYGCRLPAGHEHPPSDIARWFETDSARVTQRLSAALDELGELLGGRDPRRLLREISAATTASAER